jgi:hypothetical protein
MLTPQSTMLREVALWMPLGSSSIEDSRKRHLGTPDAIGADSSEGNKIEQPIQAEYLHSGVAATPTVPSTSTWLDKYTGTKLGTQTSALYMAW